MTPPLTRYYCDEYWSDVVNVPGVQIYKGMPKAVYLASEIDPLLAAQDETLEPLRRDSEILRKACIIEIAVANESGSVSEYMNHWEGRALKAEGALERLRAALQRIADEDDSCQCDHTDDDCCAKLKGPSAFCGHCIAEIALGQ